MNVTNTNIKQDFLRLVDYCPFLASEKSQYNNHGVLNILKQNPGVSCLRHSFRCGLGTNIHPLAVVVALGGSLEVVRIMVEACPEALVERLSGRRTVLHYAIVEGASLDVIQYLTAQNPSSLSETDSFQSTPLHLASSYPSSPNSVLRHLLHLHPTAALSLDHKSQTPLHRACKSRASLDKVLALVEASPRVVFQQDWIRNTPLNWAESMNHSLSDVCTETVEVLGMVEDILTIGLGDGQSSQGHSESLGSNDVDGNICANGMHNNNSSENNTLSHPKQNRARQILHHFRSISWWGGVSMAFICNIHLLSVLDLPLEFVPEMLSYLGSEHSAGGSTRIDIRKNWRRGNGMESIFSILVHRPVFLSFRSRP